MKTKLPLPAEALVFARDLRHATTDAEQRLWHLLRDRRLGGFKFRRQHPFPPYVLDFHCDARHLAVELDGGQHVDDVTRDTRRDDFLRAHGIRVLRFWNDAVLKSTEEVLEAIWWALHEDDVSMRGSVPSSDPSGHLLPVGEGKRDRDATC